jgi:hypothetical protein
MDCFASLAMTRKWLRHLAAHCARGLPETFRPRIQRAQGMPDARCTRDLVCNVHKKVRTRAYRAAENIRHSLRNGITAYNVISPVNGLVVTVAALGLLGFDKISENQK